MQDGARNMAGLDEAAEMAEVGDQTLGVPRSKEQGIVSCAGEM